VPLRDATEAAEAIAAGEYSRRLAVRRHDEVGRLTQAFNTMAARVEDGRSDLEGRVAARTADLREALRRLRDAQDELVRGEKLAILGQLAGSVGHELRNPLGVMSNAIYYLEMVLEDPTPEVREYVGIVRRQISLCEKIISDLLDFTRQRQAQCREVDVKQVVAEQVGRLGPLPVKCEQQVDGNLPKLWADPVQVGQIVFNLLTNAVQALEGRPDGRITVTARPVGAELHVEVADNGNGVADELRAKIFEPLFTTRARGIGLGLAVSRRLARSCGGDLLLGPPPNRGGARFVLVLPTVRTVQTVGQAS
jgi:signal transduction histidine kinase